MSYSEDKIKDDIIEILLEQSETHDELSMEDIYNALPDSEEIDQDFIYDVVNSLRRQGVEIMDEEGEFAADEADPSPLTDMDPYAGIGHISSDDTISLYLREMSRVPLLDSEEERELAIAIEKGDDAQPQDGGFVAPELAQLLQQGVAVVGVAVGGGAGHRALIP